MRCDRGSSSPARRRRAVQQFAQQGGVRSFCLRGTGNSQKKNKRGYNAAQKTTRAALCLRVARSLLSSSEILF
jgi:hypothetical protein